MRQARRRFFVGSALVGVRAALERAYAAPAASMSLSDATLRAYVDVLLPADVTPSGTALGVDKGLRALARAERQYQRVFDLGLHWLNLQANRMYGRNFPELDERGRNAIVALAARTGYDDLPRVFFERTRADAFAHYYRHPESWRGMAHYRGPPQPAGFMDYAQPPSASR